MALHLVLYAALRQPHMPSTNTHRDHSHRAKCVRVWLTMNVLWPSTRALEWQRSCAIYTCTPRMPMTTCTSPALLPASILDMAFMFHTMLVVVLLLLLSWLQSGQGVRTAYPDTPPRPARSAQRSP